MGSGANYHESAGESESFSSSLRGGPRAGICSVCLEVAYVFYVMVSVLLFL